MFSKVIKRLQFVTAVWSPKHLQLAELWSPFFSPGPESVYVCMQIKVMYKQIFYCSLWKKKKTKTNREKKRQQTHKQKEREKMVHQWSKRSEHSWALISEQLCFGCCFLASHSGHTSFAISQGRGSVVSHLQGALSRGEKSQHVQQESCRRLERSSRSSGQSQDEELRKTQPFSLGALPNSACGHTIPSPLLQPPQGRRNLGKNLRTTGGDNPRATPKHHQSSTTKEATSLLLFPKLL